MMTSLRVKPQGAGHKMRTFLPRKSLHRPPMRFAWRGVKLWLDRRLKGSVDIGFVPIQAGTDFDEFGQAAKIDVTIDRRRGSDSR